MPKREDLSSILVIGAGPIVIGQACEFDYSGTQACRVLKDEGYRVILVNSNPATIMTDPQTADSVYIEPITPEMVEKIIEKERPSAILPTVGGQTALNCALGLHARGTLDKYGVEMLGAKPDVIDKAENRQRFNEAMAKIGLDVPRNAVVQSMEAAKAALADIGLPAIIRPSFTLGGSGGGIAHTIEEFEEIVARGLDISPTSEVLIDESIIGWKEYEMEVIRDKNDNAIIVCSIENVDPMGVHTGDSITVAPALTLTDKEYQHMRDASIAVLREIGVETGGSNVQFAVHPDTGRLIVIEMNPRVSRSSALASKATGYPIAKVAARLAVGFTLDEISNDITKTTPASFEPTIDYIVTKIPRFTFEKFSSSDTLLSSQMKSVGEVMAMGRSFAESLQKGLRSLETGLTGLDDVPFPSTPDAQREALSSLSHDRLLRVAQAFRCGMGVDEVQSITKMDRWFLDQLAQIVQVEQQVASGQLDITDVASLRWLKQQGFSDARLATLTTQTPADVMALRERLDVWPVFKKVDTCAAEFDSKTPYLYATYDGSFGPHKACEAAPTTAQKVIILGGGPNRIGQGIEFDYACVHAVDAFSEMGFEAIMINCNPETVSTDYDTSDKLYFEPLTCEDVMAVIRREMQAGPLKGVVVQFGGQTPLKLSGFLAEHNIPIIGTDPDKIDLAEDRERFKALLDDVGLKQPNNDICYRVDELSDTAHRVGFPVVVRPSNVLGGRAMAIVTDQKSLDAYLAENSAVLLDGPILVDQFLQHATEIDVDALCDGQAVYVAGIMEHIEEAGIHSGDSACSLPPYTLSESQIAQVETATQKLGVALEVVGLMNVQFAFQGDTLFVIEVNPRASRSVPFVAKATGKSIAKLAARLMAGETLTQLGVSQPPMSGFAVKEAVFPFARFNRVDTLLGPEMKSTGEVMGIADEFPLAFAKAQMAAGNTLPETGTVLISVQDSDKALLVESVRHLADAGFEIAATDGTAAFLADHGITSSSHRKSRDGGDQHVVSLIESGAIDLVINTTSGQGDIVDSYALRRAALMNRVPYITTVSAAKAAAQAICRLRESTLDVVPI